MRDELARRSSCSRSSLLPAVFIAAGRFRPRRGHGGRTKARQLGTTEPTYWRRSSRRNACSVQQPLSSFIGPRKRVWLRRPRGFDAPRPRRRNARARATRRDGTRVLASHFEAENRQSNRRLVLSLSAQPVRLRRPPGFERAAAAGAERPSGNWTRTALDGAETSCAVARGVRLPGTQRGTTEPMCWRCISCRRLGIRGRRVLSFAKRVRLRRPLASSALRPRRRDARTTIAQTGPASQIVTWVPALGTRTNDRIFCPKKRT